MRGTWNLKIIDNPIFILAVLGCALGFVTNRFWFNWGDGGNSCLDDTGVPGCPSKQDRSFILAQSLNNNMDIGDLIYCRHQ